MRCQTNWRLSGGNPKMNRSRYIPLLSLVAVMVVGLLSVGYVGAVRIGDDEGCSPGFWKTNTGAWEEYSPTDLVGDVFNIPAAFADLADDTLLAALSYNGGPDPIDKAKLLIHQAVAAILNAASEDVGYPYRRFDAPLGIIPSVNSALAGGDETTMLNLKDVLDDANNLGCPLSADEGNNGPTPVATEPPPTPTPTLPETNP